MLKPARIDRHAHEPERHGVGVCAHGGLDRQRRVPGPAEREPAKQQTRQQNDEGARRQPERQRLDAREGDPLGADHDRHQVVAERAEDDRGHQHHHHGAVLADDLHVDLRGEDVVRRGEQLSPDRHGEQASRAEIDDHADQVLDADHLVVELVPEVLGQPASTAQCPECSRRSPACRASGASTSLNTPSPASQPTMASR